MTGHRSAAHRQLGVSLAVGLTLSTLFGAWAWAQQPPQGRGNVGLPNRSGIGGRTKGLGPSGPRPQITGTKTINVLEFRADPTGASSEQEIPIQAAHDSLLSQGALTNGTPNTTPGTIWLPSGTYQLNNPIWLEDKITLRGEGRFATTLVCRNGQPALIMGHRRRTAWNRNLRSDEPISTGTFTFTSGSPIVTGAGTRFTRDFTPYLHYPLFIRATGGPWYRVASIHNDRSLTLSIAYAQATVTGSGANRGIDYLKKIPAAFAADHRMDLWNGGSPKLDSSMVTAANQRFGLTSRSPTSGSPFADHWLAFPYAYPSVGSGYPSDHWEKTNQLTLDICVEGNASGPLTTDICGMGTASRPAPWWFYARPGDDKYVFTFFTREGMRNSTNAPRAFTFGHPSTGSGVQKITVQIDFARNSDGTTDKTGLCDIKAWINRTPQTITRAYGTQLTTATATEPSFTAADDWHFAPSAPHSPFCFFANFSTALWWNDLGFPSSRGNYSLYGFRLDGAPRYTTTAGVQARLDAGVLNDSYRYGLAADASRIAAIDTTMAPTADAAGRFVPMVGPINNAPKQWGLFIADMYDGGLGGYTFGTTVSDLGIIGNRGSACVLLGACLNPTIERANIDGSSSQVCIGGTVYSTYDVRLHDLAMGSVQWSWLAAMGWVLDADRFYRNAVSDMDCAIRLDGCDARLRDIRAGDMSNCKAVVMITGDNDYSSRYVLEKIDSDNEGNHAPTVALIYAERHATGFTSLFLKDVSPSAIPENVPVVKLCDANVPTSNARAAYGPGVFTLINSETGRLVVETDGPGWKGTIDNLIYDEISGWSNWHNHVGIDGQTNVQAHLRIASLPTGGSYQKNGVTVEIEQPGAAAGQKYICSQSGYGTWNSGTAYIVGNVVHSGGALYRCIKANTNSTPPSANWAPIPAWASATAYHVRDLVTHNGLVWQCNTASTNVTPVTIVTQKGSYYTQPWRAVGTNAQAMWARLSTTGMTTTGQ